MGGGATIRPACNARRKTLFTRLKGLLLTAALRDVLNRADNAWWPCPHRQRSRKNRSETVASFLSALYTRYSHFRTLLTTS